MKIIHFVSAKENIWGGVGRYVKDLCEYSVKEGYHPMIFSRGIPEIDNHFAMPGIEMRKLPFRGPLDFCSPWKLARILLSLPDDRIIVHTHCIQDAQIAVLAKRIVGKGKIVKVICTRHIVRRGKRSFRWKKILAGIDKIIFVSELAMQEFLSTNPPVKREKLTVIPNSILAPAMAVSDQEEKSCVRILFTGRISEEKGIETLIKSLSYLRNKNVELVIAGTGSEALIGSLKNMAENLKVAEHIIWAGFLDDVYSEINKSDIGVIPSICRESFGLVVIEFMSQGKPVITTNNGAQKEIITDGFDGMLVPPDDPVALADAINKLVDDKELREKMGQEAALTFQKRFTYPLFFKKIIDLYRLS